MEVGSSATLQDVAFRSHFCITYVENPIWLDGQSLKILQDLAAILRPSSSI